MDSQSVSSSAAALAASAVRPVSPASQSATVLLLPIFKFPTRTPHHTTLGTAALCQLQLFTRDEGQFGSSPGVTMTSQTRDSNDSNDQDGWSCRPANTSKVSEKSVMAVIRKLIPKVSPHFIRKLWLDQIENYVLWDG